MSLRAVVSSGEAGDNAGAEPGVACPSRDSGVFGRRPDGHTICMGQMRVECPGCMTGSVPDECFRRCGHRVI